MSVFRPESASMEWESARPTPTRKRTWSPKNVEIQKISEIFSVIECFELCLDDEFCTDFTFHPSDEYCVISNGCPDVSVSECDDCLSGSKEECQTCINPGTWEIEQVYQEQKMIFLIMLDRLLLWNNHQCHWCFNSRRLCNYLRRKCRLWMVHLPVGREFVSADIWLQVCGWDLWKWLCLRFQDMYWSERGIHSW